MSLQLDFDGIYVCQKRLRLPRTHTLTPLSLCSQCKT